MITNWLRLMQLKRVSSKIDNKMLSRICLRNNLNSNLSSQQRKLKIAQTFYNLQRIGARDLNKSQMLPILHFNKRNLSSRESTTPQYSSRTSTLIANWSPKASNHPTPSKNKTLQLTSPPIQICKMLNPYRQFGMIKYSSI